MSSFFRKVESVHPELRVSGYQDRILIEISEVEEYQDLLLKRRSDLEAFDAVGLPDNVRKQLEDQAKVMDDLNKALSKYSSILRDRLGRPDSNPLFQLINWAEDASVTTPFKKSVVDLGGKELRAVNVDGLMCYVYIVPSIGLSDDAKRAKRLKRAWKKYAGPSSINLGFSTMDLDGESYAQYQKSPIPIKKLVYGDTPKQLVLKNWKKIRSLLHK